MNEWTWVDPRVKLVRVGQAVQYLARQGWTPEPFPRPELLVFGGQVDDDGEPIEIVLPSSERLGDYRQRLIELITTLGVLEDRHPVTVLDEMLRESLPAANGTLGVAVVPANPNPV